MKHGYTEDNARPLLEQALGQRFSDGNSVKVLQNGLEIFPAMLGAIEAAQTRVDFATFVYWTGDIAQRFATTLASRAQAGVGVRVLLDAFGAKAMNATLVERMESAGVEVRWFRPLSTWRLWRSDKRTHRKLLICDDVVGYTGGVGIAQEWEGDARNPSEWRDTHLEVKGPATTDLRAAFLDNWNEAGTWSFERQAATPVAQPEDVPVQVIRASTTIGWTETATMFRSLVSLAKQRLFIVTAYFNPDDLLVDLLLAASARGVEVRLLVPGKHCDSRLSQLAGQIHIRRLLEGNIGIWRYERTMLHAKIITVDSEIACLGSANMNHRSVGKDEECCVVIVSPPTATELEERFEVDCKDAVPYELQTWVKRSVFVRMQERLARLLVEQL